MTTYRILDIENNEVLNWTLQDILEEINRDHSDKWTPYDKTDWREGWNEWCEGEFYRILD